MSKNKIQNSGIENWVKKYRNSLLFFFLLSGFVLSIMSFNAKISEAHDDALYLEGGWRFVHEFPDYFYTQNAPLYPMFLALCIAIMGFHLILLKIFSVIFFLVSVVLTFYAFENLLPALVFMVLMVFQSMNYQILYFSGMTFTESFYFFLQSLMLFSFRNFYSSLDNGRTFQHLSALVVAITFLFISLCKSSAIMVVPALLFFGMMVYYKEKNFQLLKPVLWVMGYYVILRLLYALLVRLIWGTQNQFKGQLKILLQKDPYDITQGQEDLSGFIQRLIDNSNLYLSKRFFQILGWMNEQSVETYGPVTLLMIFFIIYGIFFLYRQKKYVLLFYSLFAVFQSLLSFIILQVRWDQSRIILINMTVLLPVILYVLYHITSRFFAARMLFYFISFAVVFSIISSSLKRAWKNYPVAIRNLSGDKYYGYTPDWINFLKCSEWCADSLPPGSLVASRKAPMSFVYGKGKRFFPVYSVVKRDTSTGQSHPDSALAFFRKNGVTHIMMPHLRLDPNNPGAGFINTIHNILEPIQKKYPDKLHMVHVEGQFEECYLFEFKY